MSSIATLNGVQYIIPAYNDTGWAQGTGNLSQYLAAIASSTLQPTGGAFTLTAELDFGASYGIKALYHKTETANPSTTGVIRLASADTIGWRNNANGADITLSKDTSDNLKYNATKVLLSGAVVNADINASAAIAYSKLALTGAILNADLAGSIAVNKLVAVTVSRALVSDASGFVSASAVTAATLAFLDATSSVQTQLDAKLALTGGTLTGAVTVNLAGNVNIVTITDSNTQKQFVEKFTGATSCGLVLATNRDPSSGTFAQSGQTATSIELDSASGSGSFVVKTSDTNNTTPAAVATVKASLPLQLDGPTSAGVVQNPIKVTGGGGAGFMRVVRQASLSTTPLNISAGQDGLAIVGGNTGGTSYFRDIVAWTTGGAATVISAVTVAGSPAARTYAVTSGSLTLAMASGTYDVQCLGLSAGA